MDRRYIFVACVLFFASSVSSTIVGPLPNYNRKIRITFGINQTYENDFSNPISLPYNQTVAMFQQEFADIYTNDASTFVNIDDFVFANFNNVTIGVNASVYYNLTVNAVELDIFNKITNGSSSNIGLIEIIPYSFTYAIVIDGEWREWVNFGICDPDTQMQMQNRTCILPTNNGDPCPGEDSREIGCSSSHTGDAVTQTMSAATLTLAFLVTMYKVM